MHSTSLISMLEGPGPLISRGQAKFYLGLEGRQKSTWLHWELRTSCVRRIYACLGTYYAFLHPSS